VRRERWRPWLRWRSSGDLPMDFILVLGKTSSIPFATSSSSSESSIVMTSFALPLPFRSNSNLGFLTSGLMSAPI
jgi:hypothetical protein